VHKIPSLHPLKAIEDLKAAFKEETGNFFDSPTNNEKEKTGPTPKVIVPLKLKKMQETVFGDGLVRALVVVYSRVASGPHAMKPRKWAFLSQTELSRAGNGEKIQFRMPMAVQHYHDMRSQELRFDIFDVKPSDGDVAVTDFLGRVCCQLNDTAPHDAYKQCNFGVTGVRLELKSALSAVGGECSCGVFYVLCTRTQRSHDQYATLHNINDNNIDSNNMRLSYTSIIKYQYYLTIDMRLRFSRRRSPCMCTS
jgi:hypothetical protein